MKFRVEVDGEPYTLDLRRNGPDSAYTLTGLSTATGSASVLEVMPGVFSVLLGARSFTVHVAPNGDDLEVWTGSERRAISLADARDRAAQSKRVAATGPVEVRAQMPGKVIRLLVAPGDRVEVDQGVIVVEAMKMQNEMKSPKAGTVTKIHIRQGATVAAGEALVAIE
ncbi:MAG TPA: biotin/lipoyl-containing protein [Bryobacteraceae bacterium]